jgi:Spy/CpxP family protein refolding chaperone
MKISTLLVACALAACLVLPARAAEQAAQCSAPKDSAKADNEKGEGHGEKWKDLGLSADQKEKLKALRQEMHGMVKEHQESVKAVVEKMKTEFLKPKVDRKALSALINEQEKANRVFSEKRVDHLLKVKAVLTDAQFQKVVSHEFWGPMMGRDKEHENGRKEGDEGKEKNENR